ncbi:Tom37 C-terminal domain-containing protein [Xylogone sp. PMI_703]|nr:Tom37 C-terminal domain-containing protein [Xylogone sp. PMI_703]
MVLELYVWGPAFSLPSFDPHCLAAIAYFQQAVPREEWVLIASIDPALSPTHELPTLRNGDIYIGGFRNIFHYISQYSAGRWVLDAELDEQSGADCIAFSSFVESHGKPLLDLSLYVSTQNYTTKTRPIYNTIQPFPLPYLTPPALRDAAKQSAEHLGLSSLDIDSEGDENSSQGKSIIPESLRIPRPTVTGMLSANPENAARIRLDALAADFFEPLEKLRGKKRYFVSNEQFSSLDCLLLGYLSLMLVPDLPQPWLKNSMRKFPSLCSFVNDLRVRIYGASVTVEDAFLKPPERSELDSAPESGPESESEAQTEFESKDPKRKSILPWKAPDNRSVSNVGGAFFSGLLDALPMVGQLRKNCRIRPAFAKPVEADVRISLSHRLLQVGGVITSLGLVVGLMLHQGFISLPFSLGDNQEDKRQNTSLDDLGEAGAALAAFATQMDYEVQRQKAEEQMLAPGVEVDVEVEPDHVVRDKVI